MGKSTLFNALTGTASAQAENYPFCTIDPNSGEVAVPDFRLEQLAALARSRKMIPAKTHFVDIAGLVAGASKGQGLGNRFLASIREVDAIAHVVRCFDDPDITHVTTQVNPIDDIITIETELMLADLDSVLRQRERLVRRLKSGDADARTQDHRLAQAQDVLEHGKPVREALIEDVELGHWRRLGLLTAKPVLYICNVDEGAASEGNAYSCEVGAHAASRGSPWVVCSALFEEQLVGLDEEEATAFLESIGCHESGLQRTVSAAYQLLGLITFFTVGPKETRAWTLSCGMSAIEAAGRIHRDFSQGFIRAETVSYDDFIAHGGEIGAKEAGKLRAEGRDYRVKDGDVLRILFNV